MKFHELQPGATFIRRDSHGESNRCIKLRTHFSEWNCVYLDGPFAGGFCSTGDERDVTMDPPEGSTKAKLIQMPPFPPNSNPFQHDMFSMGQAVGKDIVMMFSNHDDEECSGMIFVNTRTGERVSLNLNEFMDYPRYERDDLDRERDRECGR